jgi:hypothetical protein
MSYVLVDSMTRGNECGKQGVALTSYQRITVYNSGYEKCRLFYRLIGKGIAYVGSSRIRKWNEMTLSFYELLYT